VSPEAQRIAIAEACGWTFGNFNWFLNGEWKSSGPPDYINSLDAMHEAIETLRGMEGPEWFDFQRILSEQGGSWMNCIQATATQRAEAFLRTLGLWKEDA
jgi:hypothetical protein